LHYISPQGLKNLRTYKYHGQDNSLVANHIMQPFWRKAVNFLPIWMAPNMVTLLGFLCIIMSYLWTVFYHSPHNESHSAIVYVANAVVMFLYQTMDALDGKQARRTGTSSPLGELFDHGCDAVTTVLSVLTLTASLQVDPHMQLAVLVTLMMAFYFTQWEEYFTDVLVLGYIGVTEAQLSSIVLYMMTAYLGPSFWLKTFHVGSLEVAYSAIPMIISLTTSTVTCISNFYAVLHTAKKKVTEALLLALPVILVSVLYVAWALYSPSNIYNSHPQLFSLTYGFLIANLVGRIVLARVCKEPRGVSAFEKLLLPSGLIPIVWLFPNFISNSYETYFLFVYCIIAIFAYLQFALSVIHDICATLKIRCLHIPYPTKVN